MSSFSLSQVAQRKSALNQSLRGKRPYFQDEPGHRRRISRIAATIMRTGGQPIKSRWRMRQRRFAAAVGGTCKKCQSSLWLLFITIFWFNFPHRSSPFCRQQRLVWILLPVATWYSQRILGGWSFKFQVFNRFF
jgi:hypothetical protein